MKTLLVGINSKYIHTCLSIRYLKSCTNDENIQMCEYTINEPAMRIVSEIYKKQPSVLMFSCYIWNIEFIKSVTRELNKVMPNLKIFYGGPEVTYYDEQVIKANNIYAVIRGEGEDTFCDLIEKNFCAENVLGVTYTKNHEIIKNPDRPLIQNISDIPFPYTDEDMIINKGKLFYYESSRGCPFNCSYCLSSTVHGVRYRDFDMVCNELLFFVRHKVSIVKFVDRTFNASRKRTYDLLKFMIDHADKTTFHFEIAADLIDDQILNLLKTAPDGLFQMEIGVQSTNIDTLLEIDRKVEFSKISDVVKNLLSLGNIHIHLDLIAGLPHEDINSFEKSFNEVLALKPHVLQLGFLKLLHGTKIRGQEEQFSYKYTSIPPYEILCNQFLSYSDVLRLKGIEDVFEKYYNSGAFTNSIQYLLSKYTSAFSLFNDLATYFIEKQYDACSHAQKTLYKFLLEFYMTKFEDNVFVDILKYDYFLNNKGGVTPEWSLCEYDEKWVRTRMAFVSDSENVQKYLPDYIGQPAKQIIKHIRFEPFLYEVCGNFQEGRCVIIFDYLNDETVLLKGDIYDI